MRADSVAVIEVPTMRNATVSGIALQARTRSPCAMLREPTSIVTTAPGANFRAPNDPVDDHAPLRPERSITDPFCIVAG